MDYLRLDLKTKCEIRDCFALIFTETWLNATVPDRATHALIKWTGALSGNSQGGGVYTNNNWCSNAAVVSSHCSLEFLTINANPTTYLGNFVIASQPCTFMMVCSLLLGTLTRPT